MCCLPRVSHAKVVGTGWCHFDALLSVWALPHPPGGFGAPWDVLLAAAEEWGQQVSEPVLALPPIFPVRPPACAAPLGPLPRSLAWFRGLDRVTARRRCLLPRVPKGDMEKPRAAQYVLSHMVNHTTMLILGGYSISAAFSR